MARRRRSLSNFVRPAPRTMVWSSIDISPVAIAADASSLIGQLSATELLLRPFTVVRTRGVIHIESDQVAASEITTGAVAMMVVSDQALAAGASAIPDPVNNADAPWFMYQNFVNSLLFGSLIGIQEPTGQYYEIDSKAMRKVGKNEDVALMIEETNNVGLIVSFSGRWLLKLH